MTDTFLQAEWRKLAMANYSVDSKLLEKYLPFKTELDLWNATCYVSLVGFMFMNTKVKGFKIPFHVNFEEVNLRFYVRYKDGAEWKRGVVFIKEIVPRPALSFVANTIYREHYETMPMKHSWTCCEDSLVIEYQWKKSNWNNFKVIASNSATDIKPLSEEEFITEHYWGYTRLNESQTSQYGVEHPRWQVYETKDYSIDVDFADLYGNEFEFLKNEKPKSVFLAKGSEIKVKGGRVI
ncbi:MAG: YqjF family protein [Cytophagaceae bacterium]